MATATSQGTGRLRVPPLRLSDSHNHVSVTPIAPQAPESDYGSDLDFDDLLEDAGGVAVQSQEILGDIDGSNEELLDSFCVGSTASLLLSGQPSQYTDGSIYFSASTPMSGLNPLIQQPSEPLLYPAIGGTIATNGEYSDFVLVQESK